MDYPTGMRILLDITAGLEEQKVRDKLIELGWTPPQGKDILSPPHPRHFGISAEHWEAAKNYAEYLTQNKQAEPVYAYRRRGLDEFCTCDESRYTELSAKPSLFEVAVFYRHPAQPVQSAGAKGEAVDLRELFERLLFGTYAGKDSYYNDEQIKHGCFERAQELVDVAKRMNIALYTAPPAAAINEQLLEALKLVLPLAKGYAAKNDVGGNQEYCVIAEAAIAEAEKAKRGRV